MKILPLVPVAALLLISCTTVANKELQRSEPQRTTKGKMTKPKAIAGMAGNQASTLTSPQNVVAPKSSDSTKTSNSAPAPANTLSPQPNTPFEKLQLIAKTISEAPSNSDQAALKLKAFDIIQYNLNKTELEMLSDSSEIGEFRACALLKLGELSLEEKDNSRAKKYFLQLTDVLPGSELANRAQEILQQLEAIKNVESQSIGVILPLSGKNSLMGQRALRGLEMGLGLHLPGSGFKLAVMDSEGNPDSARRGVEKLVKENGVIAIVGSLLSKTAPAVATRADELGVPTIGLSQKSGLTEIGNSVFRNSLTSGMQVKALVRTAMDDLKMKKFAILYPNDSYGVEFANIFWDEVLARGGEIRAVQSYSNKETDFRLTVQRLVGTFYGEARQEEFNARLRHIQKMDKKRSARQSNLETVLPPITDFDAIFIPDNVKSMGQIAAMLSYNDVRGVTLMGPNLWNTKEVAKRAGNFADHLLFVDSMTTENSSNRFAADYKSIYKEDPSLIEIQAYDSGLILRQMIISGVSSREEMTRKLTELKNFPGALGQLNMNTERELERPVTPLTIDNGEITPFKIKN